MSSAWPAEARAKAAGSRLEERSVEQDAAIAKVRWIIAANRSRGARNDLASGPGARLSRRGHTRADGPPVTASGCRRAHFGAVPLVGLPAARVELDELAGTGAAVLAGHPGGAEAPALPRGLGGRPALLAALGPVGPAHRPDGLAGVAGHGHRPLVLVAGLPRAHAAGGLPPRHTLDDGGSHPVGGHGVHQGPFPERLPLVLPGTQPVPVPRLDPDRRHHKCAGHQLPDRARQCLDGRPAVAPPPETHGAGAAADGPTGRPALVGRAARGGSPGVRGISPLDGAVPHGAQAGALADQLRAALQDGGRSAARSSRRSSI